MLTVSMVAITIDLSAAAAAAAAEFRITHHSFAAIRCRCSGCPAPNDSPAAVSPRIRRRDLLQNERINVD